eukprot:TRINITY_DN8606_c0_g1_i1.p1 TRINITY_DN8606_c0_g1~~TRINITY_DN8606_c0_g1_i1.p1  ORF type:complete len:694 (+),score=254.06 TRINITY_DN8606_c0_g1_i1:92-2173(+)
MDVYDITGIDRFDVLGNVATSEEALSIFQYLKSISFFDWGKLLLIVGAGVGVCTLVGYIINNGKSSKEIREERKRKKQLLKHHKSWLSVYKRGGTQINSGDFKYVETAVAIASNEQFLDVLYQQYIAPNSKGEKIAPLNPDVSDFVKDVEGINMKAAPNVFIGTQKEYNQMFAHLVRGGNKKRVVGTKKETTTNTTKGKPSKKGKDEEEVFVSEGIKASGKVMKKPSNNNNEKEAEKEKTKEMEEEEEKSTKFRIYFQEAENYKSKRLYEKSREFYLASITVLPKSITSVTTIVNITLLAVDASLQEATQKDAHIAIELLSKILQLIQEHPVEPQDILAIYSAFAESNEILGDYNEAEKLRKICAKQVGELFGFNHVEYASNLLLLANLYLKQKRFIEAEEKLQTSINIFEANEAYEEHISYFVCITKLFDVYLSQNKLDHAINQCNEKINIIGLSNTILGRQVSSFANSLSIFGHDEEAMKFYHIIIDEYFDRVKNVKSNQILNSEQQEIISIVASTLLEAATLLYNLDQEKHKEEYTRYLNILDNNDWTGVLGISKYLETTAATVVFSPNQSTNPPTFRGEYQYKLKFTQDINNKPLPVGTYIEVHIENCEGDDEILSVTLTQSIIDNKVLQFFSKPYTKFESKNYLLRTFIYTDESKSECIHTYFQFIPCGMDTTNIKTWRELEQSYKSI